jgi:uncharacterized protein YndB with AHSA1/START domain
MTEVTVEATISVSPEAAYDLVADVTNMGRWSPETTSCRWVGSAHGPTVGAKFRGSNRFGWRRWTTTCTVTAAEPGRRFTFDVGYGSIPIAEWTYEFAPEGSGCRVSESWSDKRPPWMVRLSSAIMGISDRAQHNRKTMEATLASLRKYAAT